MLFINKLFIKLIMFYRKFISPLFPPCCRFYPTCSQYSLQAYEKYNFFKATRLSVSRILRCNPWHEGGYDPLK